MSDCMSRCPTCDRDCHGPTEREDELEVEVKRLRAGLRIIADQRVSMGEAIWFARAALKDYRRGDWLSAPAWFRHEAKQAALAAVGGDGDEAE